MGFLYFMLGFILGGNLGVLFLFLMFFVNQRPITTIFSGITVVTRFMHGVIIYLSNLRVKVLLL